MFSPEAEEGGSGGRGAHLFPGLRQGAGGPVRDHGGRQVPPEVHTLRQSSQRWLPG